MGAKRNKAESGLDDEPSRFDLILTKNMELHEGILHNCLIEESNHEPLEMKALERYEYQGEAYKEKSKNHAYTLHRTQGSLVEYSGLI